MLLARVRSGASTQAMLRGLQGCVRKKGEEACRFVGRAVAIKLHVFSVLQLLSRTDDKTPWVVCEEHKERCMCAKEGCEHEKWARTHASRRACNVRQEDMT